MATQEGRFAMPRKTKAKDIRYCICGCGKQLIKSKSGYAAGHYPHKRGIDPEKVKAKRKRFYERHKDEILSKQKIWYRKNSEYAKQYSKEWRTRNPDRVKKLHRQWLENNREKARLKNIEWRNKNQEKFRGSWYKTKYGITL